MHRATTMTNSRHSDSDGGGGSAAFDQLHPGVREWIYRQRWTQLRDIQERTCRLVQGEGRHTIVSAPTAGGKTEAAFLPIASALAHDPTDGLGCVCVSPLKALIDDQFRRLEPLFDAAGLAMARWHGDVPVAQKRRAFDKPPAALLITPESLESRFIRRGTQTAQWLRSVRFVVIDELHAFMGTERGRQLQSLMSRMDRVATSPPLRIGLSATLGDMDAAKEFLLPGHGASVADVRDTSQQGIRLQLRGYEEPTEGEIAADAPSAMERIAAHLFEQLRGADNLVFANSRARVEMYADALRLESAAQNVPNEFYPHHGSLSQDLRGEAEDRLKNPNVPTTAVCTSTLELGIDIGSVASVAQIGTPPSVAALRQRLGRSGRGEGTESILRLYVTERPVAATTPLADRLRLGTVHSVAVVDLLLESWYEPPHTALLHLSTLVQQILALLAQYGGAEARACYRRLCVEGPFRSVGPRLFADVLRALATHDAIIQLEDGEIVLGETGDRVVGHRAFCTAFATPEEYRIVHGSKTLGTLPITFPLYPDCYLIFGGRRWRVLEVDERDKSVLVESAKGGLLPIFSGAAFVVHDRIRRQMRDIYRTTEPRSFFNREARRFLQEGRAAYRRLDLDRRTLVEHDGDTYLFTWRGDRIQNTLALMLTTAGLEVQAVGPLLHIAERRAAQLEAQLVALHRGPRVGAEKLARAIQNKSPNKFDWLLNDELLIQECAIRDIDVAGAYEALGEVLACGAR